MVEGGGVVEGCLGRGDVRGSHGFGLTEATMVGLDPFGVSFGRTLGK